MLADLDLLLIAVFCAADDLLPKARNNARRMLTDAEVVTLCVAQAIMGIPSDYRFARVAAKQLRHLFPGLSGRSGFYKRRERLSDTIEALIDQFARMSPGYEDDLLLVDSTPVECARSRETVKRGGSRSLPDALTDAADYGYCASHSRRFYGFRLHALFAPDGTPRALALTSPKVNERDIALAMLARCERRGGETVIGDKGYAGREFQASVEELDAHIIRPARKDEPSQGPHLAPIRQRIESIFWTAKDILTLERHGARTLHALRTRIACRFLALTAAIALNHHLGRPSRQLADLAANSQTSPPTRRPRRLKTMELLIYHRLAWQAVMAYRRCLNLPDVLDIGSSRRRAAALRDGCPDGFAAIKLHDGLIDSIAEHAFPALRDQRSPPAQLRDALLTIVTSEQRAGRLVFDDLGALFWRLLEDHPTIAAAYAARYPAVIADEHQDASCLQDAIVRRFATHRLIVLADHLQLIHGFRGADLERLRGHWRDSGERHELHTPHRWHGRQREGAWLLALRERLQDRSASAPRPDGLSIVHYPADRGQNGAIFHTRLQVLALRKQGHESIAVLVRNNQDVARVRDHMLKHGLYPRQLGGPRDFEEAREDIEQLPLLLDAFSLVEHARRRLLAIVPSVPANVMGQLQRRLKPDGTDRKNAKPEAAALLACFEPLYDAGAGAYFHVMDRLLATCASLGYHLPRADATAAIRRTAAVLAEQVDLADAVGTYSEQVLAVSHSVPTRTDRGLFVMTAHQAKGKEFDAIVLYALDDRFWPDDRDEHRRLFYVAMTRATRSWRLIAPDAGASPLLQLLPS